MLSQIAAAGASGVTVFGLHLRGSTRGWFLSWLARSHPDLVKFAKAGSTDPQAVSYTHLTLPTN